MKKVINNCHLKEIEQGFQNISKEDLSLVSDFIFQQQNYPPFLLLKGIMGSGKTTFVKSVIEKYTDLAFQGSPTFNIAYEYFFNSKIENYSQLIHLDLERIDSLNDLEVSGIDLFDKNNINILFCIENYDRVSLQEELDSYLIIEFQESQDKDKRNIFFTYCSKEPICI